MSSVGTFQLVLPSFPSSSSSSFTNTTLSLRPLPFPTSPLQRHPHLNRNLQHFDAISLQHRSKSGRNFGSFPCFSALSPELKTTIDKVVTSEKVVLFMKGSKDFPQCGFSHTVVQILKSLNVHFETINILENELLRQGLKEYSGWPTFPQLYIDGEFFGGCDITVEAYKSGELQEVLEKAMCSWVKVWQWFFTWFLVMERCISIWHLLKASLQKGKKQLLVCFNVYFSNS